MRYLLDVNALIALGHTGHQFHSGIVYSENPLAVVESLDNLGFETGGVYYRSIGDNWYLYREFGISKPE